MPKFLLVCCFSVLLQYGFCTTPVDSLRSLLKQETSFSTKEQIEFYRALADAYKLDQIDSSLFFLQKAASLAEQSDRLSDLGYILTDMGRIHESKEDHLEALDYFRRGYALIREREPQVPPYLLIDIGNIYFNEQVYSIARSYYDKAEKLFVQEQDTSGILLVWKNKGLTFKNEDLCDSSLYYFKKALAIELQLPGRDFEKAIAYNYLARINRCMEDKEEGFALADSAIHYMKRAGGEEKSAYVWASLHFNAAYMNLFKDVQHAQRYYQVFDDILEAHPRLEPHYAYDRLIYAKALAQQQGNYDAAIQLSHKILRDSLASNRYLPQQYKILANLYDGKGKHKIALDYLRKYIELLKKRDKDKFANKVVEMYAAMENFEQRKALSLKEMALQQERLLKEQEQLASQRYAWGAGVLLLLLGISLWLSWRVSRSSKELKRQKELIEDHAAALEDSNTTKDKLLSILAHDLRGPFSSILRLSTSLEKHLKEQPMASALQREAHSLAQTASGSYLLFEDILSWSKNQAGELRFVPEVLEISKLSQQLLAIYEGQIVEKQLQLQIDWQLLGMKADPDMLQTMLRNLLGNACKHSSYQGRISLRSGTHGADAWLEVEDEAGGLSLRETEDLFSEDKWKKRRGNSGLGLVLCQQFMQAHGGRIELHNQPGQGARFRLYFPEAARENHFSAMEQRELRFIEEELDAKELQEHSLALQNLIKLPLHCATQYLRIRQQLPENLSPALYHFLERMEEAIFTQDALSYNRLQNYLALQLQQPQEKSA